MAKHKDDVIAYAHTLDDAGVDYITCTALRDFDAQPMREKACELLESEIAAGNQLLKWKGQGYVGFQAGGVVYGVRHDSVIVRLSSDVARDHWREAYETANNITRLDLQTTVALSPRAPEIIKELHTESKASKPKRGRPPERTLITSLKGGDSYYIGRRSSDAYMRLYDKGREQGSSPAGEFVRYEIEFKGDRAQGLAKNLYAVESEQAACYEVITQRYLAAGVRVPVEPQEFEKGAKERLVPLSPRRHCTRSRKVDWLKVAVRPSVKFLLSCMSRDEVLELLGIPVDDPNFRH